MILKKSIGRALSALTAAAMLATSAQVLPKSDEKLIARAASACC